MGVPAFYRWLSEKYPRTIVDAVEESVMTIEGRKRFNLIDMEAANPNGQEFDNLFIDMNGIIHPCAHPENGEQPRTEEEMFLRLMEYVDRLVACVRPRRLLYMAIDGVAPRAKMNQQRSRRFRSAQEAKQHAEVDKEVREYMELMGQKPPQKQTPWDSNVITPGTKFMAKLSKYMRFYVRDRMNNCPVWKQFKVVFSDASVPGEGEHKLMSYIRTQRSQPGYDPNQHHVLHGLDADLIMLGLATHEAQFSVLREEVLFGKAKWEKDQKNNQTKLDANGVPDAVAKRKRGEFGEHDSSTAPSNLKPLQFLHPLQARLPFPYDFERIVDDFVFMCFFVGNDFLPHLPCMDIRDGAVDYLLLVYAKLLPSLGGYLTKPGGDVDLDKVDVILAEVGAVEESIFQRRVAKERENTMRDARRLTSGQRDQVMATVAKDGAVAVTTKRLKGGEGAAVATAGDDDDDDDSTKVLTPAERQEAKYQSMPVELALKYRIQAKEEAKLDKLKAEIKDHVRLGEPGWKTRYYEDKLKADDIEIGTILSYVEGLCWVMRYYYTGVASWQWFYPFHYAPFASDLKNIDRFKISFDVGQPFCPFEQLMGVFPADSRHAIPKPYQGQFTTEYFSKSNLRALIGPATAQDHDGDDVASISSNENTAADMRTIQDAMAQCEDEADVAAMKGVELEQEAAKAQDETFDDEENAAVDTVSATASGEAVEASASLRPIDQYAITYRCTTDPLFDGSVVDVLPVDYAEEEVELERIEAMKVVDEEMAIQDGDLIVAGNMYCLER
ncbi:hypothetical protein B5M09_003808 [Aphanomyces astaci]|uniref:Uncharacterized protein n=1 Tax=Aphanomyces astaci TaxID=112090 RepID=A0A3R7WJ00_APHAT|nr:hypothetical protein B5M09_003808 [Aphanomyces astaci]